MGDEIKKRAQKSLEYLKEQLKGIRTGRANAALVENIEVEVYESTMPLKQLATISVPEARSILIAPWDKTTLEPIEKAILKAEIGVTPSVGDDSIRINLPTMTEEKRKELVKVVKDELENARVSVRNIRKELLQELEKTNDEENVSEDDEKRQREEIDQAVKKINEEIEEIGEKKESEIMSL